MCVWPSPFPRRAVSDKNAVFLHMSRTFLFPVLRHVNFVCGLAVVPTGTTCRTVEQSASRGCSELRANAFDPTSATAVHGSMTDCCRSEQETRRLRMRFAYGSRGLP